MIKYILLFTLICFTPTLWSDEPSIKKPGKLGADLGKLIEIEGTVIDDTDTRMRAHMGKKLLRVQTVAEEKIEAPVVIELLVFTFSDVKIPPRGTKVRLRGYETGGYRGIPEEAFKDIPRVATTDFHFDSWFQVTKRIGK